MATSAKLLGAEEYVVLETRTHAKALILPSLGLILTGGLLGLGTALIPSAYRPGGQLAVSVLALVLAVWWALLPFLRWRTRTYTITNFRLITRQGIVNKTGKDLPLMRINDVSYERTLMDRMLGCGTLYIQTAAEGAIVLDDVPDVERVHVSLTELIFGTARRGPTGSNPRGQQFGSR